MPSSTTVPIWRRAVAFLSPSQRHSAFSAALLLMISGLLARAIALVRVKYVAYLLGNSAAADAFNAAFQLPDMVSYFLVGGATSITFTTILTRYRETGREKEGERTMSVILTTVALILGGGILLAEYFAPFYVRWWFNGFSADKVELCVHLTRILLPQQLCLFAGGVFAAVLLSKRIFFAQGLSLVLYSMGIVVGGLLWVHTIGISALAIGSVAGAFVGPLMLNAIGAHRAGMRYRPILDWSDPGLREWIRMSIPLVMGVSLVQADTWIINHFASEVAGGIARLGYAKQMFQAPVALSQTAGAAVVPFLASLATKADFAEFGRKVNSAISQVIAFSLVFCSLTIGLARPLIDLLIRGGAFQKADSGIVASYFCIFSISLFLWSAQILYARAFYAAADTLTPMIAATAVTAVSLPIYALLFHVFSLLGLAIASDIGIAIQTLTLAVLLHRRRMVSLGGLQYIEFLRSLLAGSLSVVALWFLSDLFGSQTRIRELALLLVGGILWALISFVVLKLTGSSIPSRLLARFSGSH